jgi:hypothetical protein
MRVLSFGVANVANKSTFIRNVWTPRKWLSIEPALGEVRIRGRIDAERSGSNPARTKDPDQPRVGCGYRNLTSYQRTILSYIAATRLQKSAP